MTTDPKPPETPTCHTCTNGTVTRYSVDGSAHASPCPSCAATPTPDPLAPLQRENAGLREKLETAEARAKHWESKAKEMGKQIGNASAAYAYTAKERDEARLDLVVQIKATDAARAEAESTLRQHGNLCGEIEQLRAEAATVAAQLAEITRDRDRLLAREGEAMSMGVNELLRSGESREALRESEAREAELRGLLEPFGDKRCLACASPARDCDRIRVWGSGECPGVAVRAWLRDHPVALPKETTE